MQKTLFVLCAVIGFSFASSVYACDGKTHKPATPTAPSTPVPTK